MEARRSVPRIYLKFVSEQTGGKPVQVLFNTDWHLENTGSNDTLGKAGTKIIAHENTKLWMSTEFHVQWQNDLQAPREGSPPQPDVLHHRQR